MLIEHHWLDKAQRIVSPNYNERPDEEDISLIVIHSISLPPGRFGNNYIDDFFCNRLDPDQHPFFREIHQLQVSAHVLIKRNGTIHQYVPFNKRAWHAGQSQYQGRSACNDFSIGIELEGTDTCAYDEQQYKSLSAIIKALIATYPKLTVQQITGHCDIAPGRKTDPGKSFDWMRLREMISAN